MCIIEGCDNKSYARGLCSKHYSQMRRYGKFLNIIIKVYGDILIMRMLLNIMKNLLTKIKHIVIGNINNLFNKNNEISYPRLLICNRCTERKYFFRMGYICKQCGCILKSKTTILDEKCPVGKW